MADAASDASEEVPKVVIKGLRSHQCESLEGVRVGSLVEVVVYEKVRGDDSPQESEGDDENDGDGSDEEGGGEEFEGMGSPGGGSEVDEPNTPVANGLASTTAKQSADFTGDIGGAVQSHLDDGVKDAAGGKESPEHGLIDMTGLGSTDSNVDAVGPADAQVALVDRLFSVSDGRVTDPQDTVASDSGHDAEQSEAEGNEVEDEGESETGEQDREDDEDEDDDEDEEGEEIEGRIQEVERDLFVVLGLVKDNNGTITDVHLRRLVYQGRGENADFDTYRIYGNIIALEDASATLQDGEEPENLTEVFSCASDSLGRVKLNPSGDHVRNTVFDIACPASCVNGWLPSQDSLHELVSDDLETLQHFRPLCPVCMGKELMNEQLLLRSLMDSAHIVDIGLVVEYLGRLNPRRRQLGYSFVQFDEREWGYGFDDMLDEEDSERDEDERFEQWDEAMDPNANPKTRPASKDTVAKLPRKKYADVIKKEEGAACAICQGPFEEGSDVVDLPCRHVYDEACLEAWIKQYDSCPECRATVSGMVGDLPISAPIDADAGETDTATLTATAHAQTAPPQDDDDQELFAMMDGEDTIMSDAIPEFLRDGDDW